MLGVVLKYVNRQVVQNNIQPQIDSVFMFKGKWVVLLAAIGLNVALLWFLT